MKVGDQIFWALFKNIQALTKLSYATTNFFSHWINGTIHWMTKIFWVAHYCFLGGLKKFNHWLWWLQVGDQIFWHICLWKALDEHYIYWPKVIKNSVINKTKLELLVIEKWFQSPNCWWLKTFGCLTHGNQKWVLVAI